MVTQILCDADSYSMPDAQAAAGHGALLSLSSESAVLPSFHIE